MDSRTFSVDQTTHLLERLELQFKGTPHSFSPEAVHDLRVAVRRFNQALAISKPFLSSRAVKKIRQRIKAIMTLAGAVRDCDIALKLVTLSKAEDVAGVEAKLRTRRADAQKFLAASLRQWTAEKSASKWRSALVAETAIAETQPVTVEAMARRELPPLVEAFFREGRRAARQEASAKQLHKFRLAAKRFRYTLELFVELYGPVAGDWVEHLRATQALLGSINDCQVTRGLVEELGAGAGILSALKNRQKRKTREFRKACEEDLNSSEEAQWVRALQHPPRKPFARATSPKSVVIEQQAYWPSRVVHRNRRQLPTRAPRNVA
jgi:CHAD domain-containing protein